MTKAAFIGLGVMGYPMAGHLATAGCDTTVFNRTTAKADQWVEQHGNSRALTPRDACTDKDFAFICVGNDDDLRSVIYGDDGVLAGLSEGSTLIDHTTASAEVAREIRAEATKRGIHLIDAPVSGGQAGAENGNLTIMCGGDENAFEVAEPTMKIYGQRVMLMGPTGSGQLTKMVNQICFAGLLQSLAEGINFAQRAGLDTEKVFNVLSKGAAQSWQMENRATTMSAGEFDFGFAVDLMRKDLSICMAEAQNNGSALPVTALVDQFYQQVQMKGGNRFDTSSLILNLRE
ncbi:MAG: NAD(P)-dependent oxidoreductase [Candidatus Sedimenticola sp. (ex Thyasira tokunagai)]